MNSIEKAIGIRAGAISQTANAMRRFFGLSEKEALEAADALHNGKPVRLTGPFERERLNEFNDYLKQCGYIPGV